MYITLTRCTLEDSQMLQEIGCVTFKETFENQNSPENMTVLFGRGF